MFKYLPNLARGFKCWMLEVKNKKHTKNWPPGAGAMKINLVHLSKNIKKNI